MANCRLTWSDVGAPPLRLRLEALREYDEGAGLVFDPCCGKRFGDMLGQHQASLIVR